MININNINPKFIKSDKISNKDILIFYFGYETPDICLLIYMQSLYINFDKTNWFMENYSGSKYLISVNENKSEIKKYIFRIS